MEYRNGFKTLLKNEQEGTSFISQRSRLNLKYSHEKIGVKLSIQNIRTWGDVPTINFIDRNGISVFEAYGQYEVNSLFFVRVGRQVFSYDNQRILGELDWAQQGQSHDALLFNILPATGQELQLVFALNEDGEDLYQMPYPVSNYKNLQLVRYHFTGKASNLSLLFLNTGYESGTSSGERETQYLQTFGTYYSFFSGKWMGDASVYGQTGERNNQNIRGWYTGGNINYRLFPKLTIGAGAEYISGTDTAEDLENSFSFTPLFGTNHAFNGLMDYFYVGNHFNSAGLQDFFGKVSYNIRNAEIAVVPHLFYAAAELRNELNVNLDPYLGTEIDIVGTHKITKDFSGSLGYSQMFGTSSLEFLKGGDAGRTQNWAWIMISFHPEIFSVKNKTRQIK